MKLLIETIGERVAEVMQAAAPSWQFGYQALFSEGGVNRVVVVPLRGGHKPTDQGGNGISAPKALAQRRVSFAAHIWADDEDTCEAIMNHTAAALQYLAPGSWTPGEEEWVPTDDTDAGVLLIFAFEIGIPLLRELDESVILEAMPTTGTVTVETV